MKHALALLVLAAACSPNNDDTTSGSTTTIGASSTGHATSTGTSSGATSAGTTAGTAATTISAAATTGSAGTTSATTAAAGTTGSSTTAGNTTSSNTTSASTTASSTTSAATTGGAATSATTSAATTSSGTTGAATTTGGMTGAATTTSGAASSTSGGPLAYLITDDAKTISHVNAKDLHSGTFKDGTAYTANGPVTFNANDMPTPTVGPFAQNDYFYGAHEIANLSTAPFTIAVLFSMSAVSGRTATESLLDTGVIDVDTGLFLQSGVALVSNFTFTMADGTHQSKVTTPDTAVPGLNVAIFGYDGTSVWLALNGATAVSATASSGPAVSGDPTSIGADSFAAEPATDANVYEVWASTDTPSAAFFASIYTQIYQKIP